MAICWVADEHSARVVDEQSTGATGGQSARVADEHSARVVDEQFSGGSQ